jgi:ribose/xylose/arabinose/galactoside ABC-type transport system permease subunit
MAIYKKSIVSRIFSRENVLGLIVLAFFIVLSIFTNFNTDAGLTSYFKEAAYLLMASAALTLIIITGNIDISAGTLMGMCGYAAAYVAKLGAPFYLFIPVAILTGVIFAGINGIIVTKFKVPSLVATLAMVNVHLGIYTLLPSGGWVENLQENFTDLGGTVYFGFIPLILIISIIVFIGIMFFMKYSPFIKKVYAVGGNKDAAVLVGVNPDKVVMITFLIEGLLIGLASIFFYTTKHIVQANSTFGMEMTFITAVVVGGTSIAGGSGKIMGTAFGVLLLAMIKRAMIFFQLQDYYSYAVQGIIIIVAVLITFVEFGGKKKDNVSFEAIKEDKVNG